VCNRLITGALAAVAELCHALSESASRDLHGAQCPSPRAAEEQAAPSRPLPPVRCRLRVHEQDALRQAAQTHLRAPCRTPTTRRCCCSLTRTACTFSSLLLIHATRQRTKSHLASQKERRACVHASGGARSRAGSAALPSSASSSAAREARLAAVTRSDTSARGPSEAVRRSKPLHGPQRPVTALA
jgi:hypothetical protein